MPLKQDTNDNDNTTNEGKYKGTNDDNIDKLLIDNIDIALSSSKEDEITKDRKDNDDDSSTLLGEKKIWGCFSALIDHEDYG